MRAQIVLLPEIFYALCYPYLSKLARTDKGGMCVVVKIKTDNCVFGQFLKCRKVEAATHPKMKDQPFFAITFYKAILAQLLGFRKTEVLKSLRKLFLCFL